MPGSEGEDPAEEALRRKGETRRLIFQNYCNGVDIEQLKAPFRRSAKEIEDDIFFVVKKINEYRLRRCADASPHMAPPVAVATLAEVRLNRLTLLSTLEKLGPLYLGTALLIPKVAIQRVAEGDKDAQREIEHRMRTA